MTPWICLCDYTQDDPPPDVCPSCGAVVDEHGVPEAERFPSPEDYVIGDAPPLGSRWAVWQHEGDHLGSFDTEAEAFAAIRRHAGPGFYPGVWLRDDHGWTEPIGFDWEGPAETPADRYVAAAERGLEGLIAPSVGGCSSCSDCRSLDPDYRVEECYSEETDDGPEVWTFPAAGRARYDSVEAAERAAAAAFEEAGDVDLANEGGFSWSACGICGSTLGGDRYVWHYLDADGALLHEDDACLDCVLYLANGDVPEDWEG